jgi:glycerol kinase
MLETTALGAGLLAGLGAGLFEDLDAVRDAWHENRRFTPAMTQRSRDSAIALWNEGLKRV